MDELTHDEIKFRVLKRILEKPEILDDLIKRFTDEKPIEWNILDDDSTN